MQEHWHVSDGVVVSGGPVSVVPVISVVSWSLVVAVFPVVSVVSCGLVSVTLDVDVLSGGHVTDRLSAS